MTEQPAKPQRGDTGYFVGACSWCLLVLLMTILVYDRMEPFAKQVWGNFDDPYLQRYRLLALALWKTGRYLTCSLYTGIGLGAVFGGLWLLQTRLQKRKARVLVSAFAVVYTLLIATLALAPFRVMMLPMNIQAVPPATQLESAP